MTGMLHTVQFIAPDQSPAITYHQHPDFDLLFQIFNGAQLGMVPWLLVGWLVGRSVGRSVGRLVGWLVGWCLMCATRECGECEALPRSGIPDCISTKFSHTSNSGKSPATNPSQQRLFLQLLSHGDNLLTWSS